MLVQQPPHRFHLGKYKKAPAGHFGYKKQLVIDKQEWTEHKRTQEKWIEVMNKSQGRKREKNPTRFNNFLAFFIIYKLNI